MLSTLHTIFLIKCSDFLSHPHLIFSKTWNELCTDFHIKVKIRTVFSHSAVYTLTLISLSTSQWPTGPWIRPTSSEKQRLQEPTRWRRRVWRESRTLLHQPGWSTRLVTMVTVGRTNTLHRFDSLASSPAVTMLETSFLKRDQGLIELNKVSAAHLS